jgi:ssDNA-binding Zn-finger/Zn-ribbon topoisomerase 1
VSSTETATTPTCPAHGATMQLRRGRTGEFYGCSHYPACRETVPIGLPGFVCPQCGAPIIERIAKKSGRPFWPCSVRGCEFVAWKKPHRCAHGAACFGEETPAARQAAPQPSGPAQADGDIPF